MTPNTKQEYETPQVRQLRMGVEEGYALSRQNVVETSETPIHFTTTNGSW